MMISENELADLYARIEQLENRGVVKQLCNWVRTCDVWRVTTAVLTMLLALTLLTSTAWGAYTHYTNDPAYWDAKTQTVIQDPYEVNECPSGNCVVYWGPIGPDRWQDIEAAGWPYELTRTFLAARYPVGLPNHFHFDHDAAAQLLARGLRVPALDRLFIYDRGFAALPTTQG